MMQRRDLLKMAGLGFVSTLIPKLPALAENAGTKRKLNVLFILIDDMGQRDLSCYGSKIYETPNIDKLASEGMLFTDGYAACPVCSPTRASIMTGKYPARLHLTDWIAGHEKPKAKLKIPDWTKYLPLEETTIAEELKKAGYVTASIGKWHLGGDGFLPESQGFDVNVSGNNRGHPPSYFYPYSKTNGQSTVQLNLKDGETGEYLTDRLGNEALQFIEKNKDKPFFLYFPNYAVHTPIQAKKEIVDKYIAKGLPEKGQNSAAYAAMIESVDENIGKILKKLDELGIADNTAVFFMSDNGGLESVTSNAPYKRGKGTLYEGGIREPWIVKWPGAVKPGTVCKVPVISTDFYSTILEMTQLAPAGSHTADGQSIVPLPQNTGTIDRQAIYWHYPHYHETKPAGAVRCGDYKLIEYYEDGNLELYDLSKDLSETTDLAAKMPEKAAELRKMLDDWRKSVGAQMPTPNPDYVPEPQANKIGKSGNGGNSQKNSKQDPQKNAH